MLVMVDISVLIRNEQFANTRLERHYYMDMLGRYVSLSDPIASILKAEGTPSKCLKISAIYSQPRKIANCRDYAVSTGSINGGSELI
jgi:hypothetical protein